MTFIGTRRETRLTCSGGEHLPGCFNPHPWPNAPTGGTACICGEVWWDGPVGVWISSHRRMYRGDTGSMRAEYDDLGWDTYFLHAPDCEHKRRKSCKPACGGAEPGTWPHQRTEARRTQHAQSRRRVA